MQWNSVADFFFMGGYALYVWSSFGLTLLVLLIEIVGLRLRQRQAIKQARQVKVWAKQREKH